MNSRKASESGPIRQGQESKHGGQIRNQHLMPVSLSLDLVCATDCNSRIRFGFAKPAGRPWRRGFLKAPGWVGLLGTTPGPYWLLRFRGDCHWAKLERFKSLVSTKTGKVCFSANSRLPRTMFLQLDQHPSHSNEHHRDVPEDAHVFEHRNRQPTFLRSLIGTSKGWGRSVQLHFLHPALQDSTHDSRVTICSSITLNQPMTWHHFSFWPTHTPDAMPFMNAFMPCGWVWHLFWVFCIVALIQKCNPINNHDFRRSCICDLGLLRIHSCSKTSCWNWQHVFGNSRKKSTAADPQKRPVHYIVLEKHPLGRKKNGLSNQII